MSSSNTLSVNKMSDLSLNSDTDSFKMSVIKKTATRFHPFSVERILQLENLTQRTLDENYTVKCHGRFNSMSYFDMCLCHILF
jgi:hypothetical protein